MDRPHGTALDVRDGMIYWTDTTMHTVNRGSMDGSGSVEVLYTYGTSAAPWDIEIVPEPSTLVLVMVGLLCGVVVVWGRRH